MDLNSIGSYKTEAHTKKQMELLTEYQKVISIKLNQESTVLDPKNNDNAIRTSEKRNIMEQTKELHQKKVAMCLQEISRLDKAGGRLVQMQKVVRLMLDARRGEIDCEESLNMLKNCKEGKINKGVPSIAKLEQAELRIQYDEN